MASLPIQRVSINRFAKFVLGGSFSFKASIKPVFNSFIIITMSNEKSSTLVTYIERKLFREQVHS